MAIRSIQSSCNKRVESDHSYRRRTESGSIGRGTGGRYIDAVRLAESVVSLSVARDRARPPMGSGLRNCVLGRRSAEKAGLDADERRRVFLELSGWCRELHVGIEQPDFRLQPSKDRQELLLLLIRDRRHDVPLQLVHARHHFLHDGMTLRRDDDKS